MQDALDNTTEHIYFQHKVYVFGNLYSFQNAITKVCSNLNEKGGFREAGKFKFMGERNTRIL